MEESDEEEAQVQQAAEALLAGEMAPPCLDVTLALRYMTHNGRITFHQVCACTFFQHLWCHSSVGLLAVNAVCSHDYFCLHCTLNFPVNPLMPVVNDKMHSLTFMGRRDNQHMHLVAICAAKACLGRFELHSFPTHLVTVLSTTDCKVLV